MYTIYAFENKFDGRVYMGQSVRPAKRLSEHRKALNSDAHQNKFLQRAWNKDGENAFSHFVLMECETKEEADVAEIALIEWYKSLNLCYNHAKGGDGGNTVTPANKEAISAKIKARLATQGHPMQGKKHTEESRRKMSEAKRGVSIGPHSDEHKRKMSDSISASWTPERKAAFGQSKMGNKNFQGRTHSEETKQRMSQAKKGQGLGIPSSQKQKESASRTWKGVKRGPFTEEHKQKIRDARAKQVINPHSQETKDKLRQMKLERDAAKKA